MSNVQFLANFYIETKVEDDIFNKTNVSNVISNRPENNFKVCNITINKQKLLEALLPQLRTYCKDTRLNLSYIKDLETEHNFSDLADSMIRVNKNVRNKLYNAPKHIYWSNGLHYNSYPISAWNNQITLEICLFVKNNIAVFLVNSALLEKYLKCSAYSTNRLTNVEFSTNGKIGTHHRPSASLFDKIRIMYRRNIPKDDISVVPVVTEPVKEMAVTTAEVELIKEVVMNPETKNNVQDILSFLHDVITAITKINELRKTKRIDYDPKNQTPIVSIKNLGYDIHGGDTSLTHVSIHVNGKLVMSLLGREDLVKFVDRLTIVETTKVSFETLLKAE